MLRFRSLFNDKRWVVIGMIHVGALPGSPLYRGSVENLVELASKEAEIYNSCSVDAVILENMHDIPYLRPKNFGPEIVSTMTRVCSEVRKIISPKIPCGVQVLAGGNEEAIAVAKSSNLQFIRAEGFVFSHVADEGITDACAGPLLRYRKRIEADDILVFTDIKKKHCSHAITKDVNIEETAKAAQFFQSDGVVITGSETGSPADSEELKRVKKHVEIPVLIGSGITPSNLKQYELADGFIVGSYFKRHGSWKETVSKENISIFMDTLSSLKVK